MGFKIQWDDVPEKADSELIEDFFSISEIPEKNIKNQPEKVQHVFIEGDNYPALRLLEKSFNSSIDFIYIDPPYNTGKKSFIYNDSLKKCSSNTRTKTDSQSAWLSFMKRRLECAQNLLSETGCIFIAIGQEEVFQLKLLCDQIFGEKNFVNNFMWLHGKGKKDKFSRTMQESNLCYAKDIKKLAEFTDYEITDWAKNNMDNDSRGPWFSGSISFDENRSNPEHKNYYEITSPSGIKWKRQWLIPENEMKELLAQKKIYFGPAPEYANVPRKKVFNGEKIPVIPKNIIEDADSTRDAQNHVDQILGQKISFDNPKPVNLIRHFIEITGMKKDITVMDFFAGSGTTLEAVSEQNKADGGKRKCILIQKPEKITKESSKFSTISELCWQRAKYSVNKNGENLKFLKLNELK